MAVEQDVFQRVEKKYLLTREQYQALMPVLQKHMQVDEYGKHTISNIYYDTDQYDLIQTSLEKPLYKEKLRLRGYGEIAEDTGVFVEIKKKYKDVVYKRRVKLPLEQAERFLAYGVTDSPQTQIHREIAYFCKYHQVEPRVYLAYDRVALFGLEDPELRVTFDENIRFRTDRLSLTEPSDGTPILSNGQVLMEIKIPQAMPLWMAHTLSALEIFSTSFSKYGACYQRFILPAQLKELRKGRKIVYVA